LNSVLENFLKAFECGLQSLDFSEPNAHDIEVAWTIRLNVCAPAIKIFRVFGFLSLGFNLELVVFNKGSLPKLVIEVDNLSHDACVVLCVDCSHLIHDPFDFRKEHFA